MFTTVDLRDRLPYRLSQLTGLAVVKDELSGFICKKCVTALEQQRMPCKRHNISKEVSKEMNELEDFFHAVAKAHVTAAAMHYCGMQEKTEKPTKHAWPHLLL